MASYEVNRVGRYLTPHRLKLGHGAGQVPICSDQQPRLLAVLAQELGPLLAHQLGQFSLSDARGQ